MATVERLRIVTYNVHRCVGRDGQLSPSRIIRVLSAMAPDIVALQELDVNRPRTGYADQASLIARGLGIENRYFFPAHARQHEHFGDAILTRLPMRLMRAGHLPTLPGYPHLERRGAIWVAIDWQETPIQIMTTHLGLWNRERLLQVDALLGSEWLRHEACQAPVILCGDFNAVPGTRAYRRLRTVLHDPVPWGVWPPGTFPSRYPILPIDHILLSADWEVHRIEKPRTRLSRMASDHLPLLAEVSLR